MYYRNKEVQESGRIVFYEIFRRHQCVDRGGTYTEEYLVGTTDSVLEAGYICTGLNLESDKIVEKSKNYKMIWESEEILLHSGLVGVRSKSTGNWEDPDGYAEALEKFRLVDPSYYSGESPVYMYRPVRRAKKLEVYHVHN